MKSYNTFKQVVNDIVTEKDGYTYCPTRFLMVLGVFVFFGCSIFAIFKGQPFSPTEYGIGFGSILAAGSAGIKMKETTEQGYSDSNFTRENKTTTNSDGDVNIENTTTVNSKK